MGHRCAHDQPIAKSLMIAFAMIVRDELHDEAPEVPLPQRNDPIQALFLDRPDESFCVGIRLRRGRAYVHFRAMSCRCQRSNVFGVATVEISRKAARPTRYARAASRRRSSSLKRSRCFPSWRRKSPFSSIRYVTTSRSRRSSQPQPGARWKVHTHETPPTFRPRGEIGSGSRKHQPSLRSEQ
jgi:hypothetical protein